MKTVNPIDDRFELLNGRVLQGQRMKVEKPAIDNSLRLDTTGVCFALNADELKTANVLKNEWAEQTKEAFIRHAFVFLKYSERIFADSRMFLAPVPIQNMLAFTGNSGFLCPTLGVYLEWWLNCSEATIWQPGNNPENGPQQWLVWYISGSAMSGKNSCAMVNAQGETVPVSVPKFKPLWTSFQKINARYDAVKARCKAYSIAEVIEKLKESGVEELQNESL